MPSLRPSSIENDENYWNFFVMDYFLEFCVVPFFLSFFALRLFLVFDVILFNTCCSFSYSPFLTEKMKLSNGLIECAKNKKAL